MAETTRTRTRRKLRLLPREQQLLVRRFSYGLTPALAAEVRRAGGSRAWFGAQLACPVPDPTADTCDTWWPQLAKEPVRLWEDSKGGASNGFTVMCEYQRYVLARRITATHQVREVMTEFWEQLLNVPTNGEPSFVHRVTYGATLRRLALSSYEEILTAAVLHPAMLTYLDNARSTAEHPNENLGRELLELHTVGRGNYDEDQVKDSARILTGYAVDTMERNPTPSWRASYEPSMHYVGPVRVLGFSQANSQPDGRAVATDYLSYLARHPLTAQRVARRLATKFVRDDPSQGLVDRLAQVYLDQGTRIAPVLEALADSPELAASEGAKVRDPAEDVVATYRALGVTLRPPTQARSAANAILWQCRSVGLMPYAWPRPDGAPLDNTSWSNPSRMLASYRVHATMSGGYYPDIDIGYRDQRAWLPALPARFDVVVDHLSRQLLHRPASSAMVQACAQAAGRSVGEVVTASSPLLRYGMPRLIVTLLDSPDHFLR